MVDFLYNNVVFNVVPCLDVVQDILPYVSYGDNLRSANESGTTLTPISLPACFDDVGCTSIDPDADWHIEKLDKMEVRAATRISKEMSDAMSDLDAEKKSESSQNSETSAEQ